MALCDGILDDPRRCDFDPSTLLCEGSDAETCLTAPQIEALNKLYDGAVNPTNGGAGLSPAFPRAANLDGVNLLVLNPGTNFKKPNPIANSFFKYMVFEDPNWRLPDVRFRR